MALNADAIIADAIILPLGGRDATRQIGGIGWPIGQAGAAD
jgi:hypothetical protein